MATDLERDQRDPGHELPAEPESELRGSEGLDAEEQDGEKVRNPKQSEPTSMLSSSRLTLMPR